MLDSYPDLAAIDLKYSGVEIMSLLNTVAELSCLWAGKATSRLSITNDLDDDLTPHLNYYDGQYVAEAQSCHDRSLRATELRVKSQGVAGRVIARATARTTNISSRHVTFHRRLYIPKE